MPSFSRRRPQRLEIEAVQACRVLAEHHADLLRIDVGEREPHVLARVRVAALVVRIIVAPQDAVHADDVAALDVRRGREARAVPAVALRVEARRLLQGLRLRVVDLPHHAHLHAQVDAVHAAHEPGRPGAARLGQDVAQAREALEDTAEDQLTETALHEERHLHHPQRLGALVARRSAASPARSAG